MMHTRLIVAWIALLLLAGCAGQATSVGPVSSPGVLMEEQTVDGLTIGFQALAEPKLNVPQDLVVSLADAQGNPVSDAAVSFELTMPAMPMGSNTPIAQAIGQGSYRASNVVMDMTGEWDITVIVNVAGREHRALFKRTAVP